MTPGPYHLFHFAHQLHVASATTTTTTTTITTITTTTSTLLLLENVLCGKRRCNREKKSEGNVFVA